MRMHWTSESSHVPATTTDFNENKFSMVSFMSAESGFYRGSQSSFASENWTYYSTVSSQK